MYLDKTVAHTRRRIVEEFDRVAGGIARAQATRRLYRVASGSGERTFQRRLRSPRHCMGCE